MLLQRSPYFQSFGPKLACPIPCSQNEMDFDEVLFLLVWGKYKTLQTVIEFPSLLYTELIKVEFLWTAFSLMSPYLGWIGIYEIIYQVTHPLLGSLLTIPHTSLKKLDWTERLTGSYLILRTSFIRGILNSLDYLRYPIIAILKVSPCLPLFTHQLVLRCLNSPVQCNSRFPSL